MENKSNTIVIFVLLVAMSFALLLNSYRTIETVLLESQHAFTEQSQKTQYLTTMYNAAKDRSVILLKMFDTNDIFELDEYNQDLGQKARIFITAQRSLRKLPLSTSLKTTLERQFQLATVTANLQLKISELLIEGKMSEAKELFFLQTLPKQNEVLHKLNIALKINEQDNSQSILELGAALETSGQDFVKLGFVLLSIVLFTFIIFYTRTSLRAHKQLQAKLIAKEQHINEIQSYQDKLEQQKTTVQESYTKLELLIENTAVGIWDWEIESDERSSNERCAQILGYTTQSINAYTGQSWLEKIHPDDLYRVKSELSKHYRNITDRYCLEIRMLHNKGHWVWVLDAGKVIERNSYGQPIRMIGTFLDITERMIATEKLSYQASHDSLTGLYNRIEFEQQLKQALTPNAIAEGNVLLFLDLDQFKTVNDTCGHSAGDELLRQIPELIRSNCRESDVLARMGGDEFALILYACSISKAEIIAQKIIKSISDYQFLWENKSFKIGVSIGIVSLNSLIYRVEEALQYADSACFSAKDAGRNCYSIYTIEQAPSPKIIQKNTDWLPKIEHSLKSNLFEIHAQPVMSLKKPYTTNSYEFLIRMKSDIGSITLPKLFLPTAKRNNKMLEIDLWVIKHTIEKLKDNLDIVRHMRMISINISSQSLTSDGFIKFCLKEAENHPELFQHICFEIKENIIISNLALATKNIHKLKDKGIIFAIDNFGNSLLSFRYLKKLPIHYLKIDDRLINNIDHEKLDYELLQSISTMSKILEIHLVAKLISHQKTIQTLTDIGISFGQSHLLAKPIPLDKVIKNISNEINLSLEYTHKKIS